MVFFCHNFLEIHSHETVTMTKKAVHTACISVVSVFFSFGCGSLKKYDAKIHYRKSFKAAALTFHAFWLFCDTYSSNENARCYGIHFDYQMHV